jgi:molybdopterin/thiamine biosynthesis adenylyltransferase/rhodanese-related sulfurtransferase
MSTTSIQTGRDFKRYARQALLPEIGQEGQRRLSEASVLCVGVGGLGSPLALYLAAAGVGRLTLLDDDQVDLTNLQRQILFKTQDAGRPKVEAALDALRDLNPQITLEAISDRLTVQNALDQVGTHDLVVDGSDNFSTKLILNDAAFKTQRSFVSASVQGFESQVVLFRPSADRKNPCYRCLNPGIPRAKIQNCAQAGVLGSVVGTAGTLQASLVLQELISQGDPNHPLCPKAGQLSHFDFRGTWSFRQLMVPQRRDCPVCTQPVEQIEVGFDLGSLDPEAASESCASTPIPEKVTAPELRKLFASSHQAGLTLLDVRTKEEFEVNQIPSARNLPLNHLERCSSLEEFADSLNLSSLDKSTLIIYCQSGVRSAVACQKLLALGHPSPRHLDGGLNAWEESSPPQS